MRITASDAKFVIDTVRSWLAYLTSTIGFESALLELKRWVESTSGPSINSQEQAGHIVAGFFERTTVTKSLGVYASDDLIPPMDRHAKLILDLDRRLVLVETRFRSEEH